MANILRRKSPNLIHSEILYNLGGFEKLTLSCCSHKRQVEETLHSAGKKTGGAVSIFFYEQTMLGKRFECWNNYTIPTRQRNNWTSTKYPTTMSGFCPRIFVKSYQLFLWLLEFWFSYLYWFLKYRWIFKLFCFFNLPHLFDAQFLYISERFGNIK